MKSFLTLMAIVLFTLPMIAQNQERLIVHFMDIKPQEYQEFVEYHNKKMKYLKMPGMARIFINYTK